MSDNQERINMIKKNMTDSQRDYDAGKITREQLDILHKEGNKRIKELKK